ncbi:uncharacterized protein LOC113797380 isoform X3 [Dermatophagoides pteronyssinus]|uniref:uncharacterized protein LOC113797380 isoform X3 n=1 Tax=Dermatophagoides pteronyssinus TaxID=6956 RepID=UPI003F67AED4
MVLMLIDSLETILISVWNPKNFYVHHIDIHRTAYMKIYHQNFYKNLLIHDQYRCFVAVIIIISHENINIIVARSQTIIWNSLSSTMIMKQQTVTIKIWLDYSLWTLPFLISMSLFCNNKVPYQKRLEKHNNIDAYVHYQHHQQYQGHKIAIKMKNNFTASHMIQHHQQKPKNVKESDKVLFSVHFDRSLLTRRLLNVVVVIVIMLSSFSPNVILFVLFVLVIFMLMIMSCLLSLTTKKHRKQQQQQQQNDYFQHNQCRNQCDDDTSLFKWNVDVVDNDVVCRHLIVLFFHMFDPKEYHCFLILFLQIINNYVCYFVKISSKILTLLVNSHQFVKCMIFIFLIINNFSSLAFAQFTNGAHSNYYNHHNNKIDRFRSLILSSSSSSSSFNTLNSDYMNDLFPQNSDQFDNDKNNDEDDDDQTAYPTIRALLGKSVGLPCNISQSIREGNSIKLVLWYKNNVLGSPIYSVDARDTQNFSLARHFIASSYQQRASYEMNLATRTASLIINPVEDSDDGHYICRVDYRWTRTTISNVRLEVIVPPFMIQIVQSYQYQPEPISMMSTKKMGVGQHGIYFPMKKINITIDSKQKSFERNFHYSIRSTMPFTSSIDSNDSPTLSSTSTKQSNNGVNSGVPTSSTMINDVTTIRQPESSTLTLSCDSIGGKPMSMIKWYRLTQFENANLTDAQLYTLLQSSEEKSMQLIDDSYYPMLLASLPSNIPRLLFTNNLNFTSKNSAIVSPNIGAASAEMIIQNKMNKNLIRLNYSTTTTTKTKDSAKINMEQSGFENINNGMMKIPIVRNELHIGKISIDNHGQLYLCKTINTNLTRSIDIIVRLEVFAGPKTIQIEQRLPAQDGHFHGVNNDDSDSHPDMTISNNNRTWHSIELLDHYLHRHGSSTGSMKIASSSSTEAASFSSASITNNNHWTHAKKSFRLRSGYEFDFTCQTNGSLPDSQIFWYLRDINTNRLRNITEFSNMYQNGHNTLSYLRIVPQYTDNKANLICQAYNPSMLQELILSLKLWLNYTTNVESSLSSISKQIESSSNQPNFSLTKSSSLLPLISSSSSSSSSSENDDSLLNQDYLNSIITNLMMQDEDEDEQQQQYFHHHQQDEQQPSKNLFKQLSYYLKHYPFQLFTSVYLDVNYKPIVLIKVLSGEQMYHEVSSSNSNINNDYISNRSNASVFSQTDNSKDQKYSNLNNNNKNNNQQTTTTTTATSSTMEHYYRFIEMSEIFFNCTINSNPESYLIEWFMNKKLIYTDIPKGIIITNTNRTLIISPSQRRSSGIYHCSATNILGKTVSDRVQIDILFKPQCQVEFVQTYYQHLDDYVQLKCHIIANPSEDVQFTWRFNDTVFIGDINSAYTSSSSSSESFVDHVQDISSSSSIEDVIDQEFIIQDRNKINNDKQNDNHSWKTRRILPRPKSTSIHTTIDHQHLVTNVIRIHLKKWSSFGQFTCTAKNSIGIQSEPCRWQLIPHHYHTHYRNSYESSMNNIHSNRHQYHHHQQQQQQKSQSLMQQFSSSSSFRLPNQLNNCHIIESSNAVVIKCSNGVEVYERTSDNTYQHLEPIQHTINMNDSHYQNNNNHFSNHHLDINNNNNVYEYPDDSLSNQQVRPLLTYHVQVFRLSMNNNSISPIIKTLENHKANEKMADYNFDNDTPNNDNNNSDNDDDDDDEHFEQYSHQKSGPKKTKISTTLNQPETKKQIASIHNAVSNSQSESPTEMTTTKTTITNEPLPIMETLNFTNPLFIITNLTSSTSYLLRIWSSKQHMDDSMIEQVNITVRTKPDDDVFDHDHHQRQQHDNQSQMNQKSMKILDNLLSLISFGHKDLFIILIILLIFIIVIFTYAIRKVYHHNSKAGRDVNDNYNDINEGDYNNNNNHHCLNAHHTNENERSSPLSSSAINVFETALCEMRPETLENDLKFKNLTTPSSSSSATTTTAATTGAALTLTNPYSAILDTFKPYHMNMENLSNDHQSHHTATSSSALIIKCDLPDSSIITYQNYLFPLTTCESTSATTTTSTTTTTNSITEDLTMMTDTTNNNDTIGTNVTNNHNHNNNSHSYPYEQTSQQSHTANFTRNEFTMNMNDPTTTLLEQQNYHHLHDLIHNHHHHRHHRNNSNHHHYPHHGHSAIVNDSRMNNSSDDNVDSESYLLSNSFQYPLSVRIVPTDINDANISNVTSVQVATESTTDIYNSNSPNNDNNNNNNNNSKTNKIHTLV